jgi:probable F420-dependent oxidoreductase
MASARFGLMLPTSDYGTAREAAVWAEGAGFDAVSLNDHFFSPHAGPSVAQLECLTTLTAVAAVTARVRIVPSVLAASFRSPQLLARIGATLDHVSGGRFVLGIGSGWFATEYDAHGYPFPDTAERLDRLEETIEIVKAMWTADEATFHGRYYRADRAATLPRPLQQPHPPMMVGGSSRHLLQIAAKHADIVNLIPPTANNKDFIMDRDATVQFDRPRLRRRIELLREFTSAAGNDPQRLELSGFLLASLDRDPNHPVFEAVARRLGFGELREAQSSPIALIGTPSQAIDELHDRVERDGVSFFIVVATSVETRDLLAAEILPALS